MLDLDAIDVEVIATALADQTDYEHRWLIGRGPKVAFWTSDMAIDGESPVELDELHLVLIDPLPSHVWHRDLVDFADGISDHVTGERLGRCLEGKGAFRWFKNMLYQGNPELISSWQALRGAGAQIRAVAVAGRRRADRTGRPSTVRPRPPRARIAMSQPPHRPAPSRSRT